MREQYRLGFVDVGGWDTHVNQGSVTGGLANNLRNLGEGLAAYADALGDEWNDTTVVVLSEFGRTFRENGDKGTDHGHGTTYWVLGGSVRGGRIAGEQVAVTQPNLLQNRAAISPGFGQTRSQPQQTVKCLDSLRRAPLLKQKQGQTIQCLAVGRVLKEDLPVELVSFRNPAFLVQRERPLVQCMGCHDGRTLAQAAPKQNHRQNRRTDRRVWGCSPARPGIT